MAASGVTMQHLQQEALHRGDWQEHAVAPPGLADLATGGETRFGWQQRGPLACQAVQDGGDVRNPLVTSSMRGALTPIHTGDA
jgi:hypothetical protein